jgi:hypothetical protein
MALVACKECKKEISDSTRICPGCGAAQHMNPWWWIVIAPVGGFVALMVLGSLSSGSSSPEDQAKANKRAAIELCWQEQQRKSLDPSTQRFVAGTCEMMEREFVAKYGVKP